MFFELDAPTVYEIIAMSLAGLAMIIVLFKRTVAIGSVQGKLELPFEAVDVIRGIHNKLCAIERNSEPQQPAEVLLAKEYRAGVQDIMGHLIDNSYDEPEQAIPLFADGFKKFIDSRQATSPQP